MDRAILPTEPATPRARTPPIAGTRRRRNVATHGPDPVDVHVGAQLRRLRRIKRLSQSSLAGRLGVTFQQVQKYERGVNRVSASMLYRAAEILDVPVGYFFDGLGDPARTVADPRFDDEIIRIARLYAEIPVPLRDELVRLIEAIRKSAATTSHDQAPAKRVQQPPKSP